ncbi:hypothetical protein NL676_012902 [Syzygium grande]|nr:hypothetical protein NL676_012902 [Syzygium grande]
MRFDVNAVRAYRRGISGDTSGRRTARALADGAGQTRTGDTMFPGTGRRAGEGEPCGRAGARSISNHRIAWCVERGPAMFGGRDDEGGSHRSGACGSFSAVGLLSVGGHATMG